MRLEAKGYVAGIDVGAGSGTRIGLFDGEQRLRGQVVLSTAQYGSTAAHFVEGLATALRALLCREGIAAEELGAVGVACPGFLRSDGTLLGVTNLPFLIETDLKDLLSAKLAVPVECVNDADAGSVAVWSTEQVELMYWVFGGGWGGAWVLANGQIQFPALDWDGDDKSLHYSNEPGYAIPLDKRMLEELFGGVGVEFEQLTRICVEDLHPPGGVLTGPSGRSDCVRAEVILSGPGRWRIFRTITGTDRSSFRSCLSEQEIEELEMSATAGRVIDKLGELEVESAVRTDRLFGQILAEAGALLIDQAVRDGCARDIPVFLAGKPSRALPFFGPSTREGLERKGIKSSLNLARLEREGQNANLLGAAWLARGLLQDRC